MLCAIAREGKSAVAVVVCRARTRAAPLFAKRTKQCAFAVLRGNDTIDGAAQLGDLQ